MNRIKEIMPYFTFQNLPDRLIRRSEYRSASMSEIKYYQNCWLALEKNIIEARFKGIDPYDFYGSKYFGQAATSKIASKVSFVNKVLPLNLRKIFGIDADYSPKAMALLLSGYLFQGVQNSQVKFLKEWLVQNKSTQYEEYGIGIPFNLALSSYVTQKNEVSLIISLFVMFSFIRLYEKSKEAEIWNCISSFERLIENRLPKKESKETLCYSYNFHQFNEVYNATAKLGRFYALLYGVTGLERYRTKIQKILNYIHSVQRQDGSWPYAANSHYSDNFHTAFVLESIWYMLKHVPDEKYKTMFELGLADYKQNFFDANCRPYHFHPLYQPNDIRKHLLQTELRDSANAIPLFLHTGQFDEAQGVLDWTMQNLYDQERGYFYFYTNKFYTNKVNFFRFQAWMFYSISFFLNEVNHRKKKIRN